MDDALLGPIHELALEARSLLIDDVRDLLAGVYGLDLRTGTLAPANDTVRSDPEVADTHHRLGRWLDDERAAGLTGARACDKLVKETAFTHLNRCVAFKMMEARKLIRGTLDRGLDSNGFKFYLADNPADLALFEAGTTPRSVLGEGPRDTAYRHFLLSQTAVVARDIAALFDPDNLASRLFPRPPALQRLLEWLNAPALAGAWQPENDETIGWVYQYFNETEKHDVFERLRVQKRKFQPEDIPAATQLFTPRWIVRFLVQNSLGRTWLQMHPGSSLAAELDLLLPLPGEVPPVPLRPVEEISVLDPACGTMHFGLVAFDLLAAMYREEITHAGEPGWPAQPSVASEDDIPAAIVANNLFGIDIDLRAVQLSALTLYLKAKSLNPKAELRQGRLACADVLLLNGERLDAFLREFGFTRPIYERLLRAMWERLRDASIAGSLVRADVEMRALIAAERARYEREGRQGGLFGEQEALFEQSAAEDEFWTLLEAQLEHAFDAFARREDGAYFSGEALKGMRILELLMRRYDVVLANPPYGSSGNLHDGLATFLKRNYPDAKGDLYAAFIARCTELLAPGGRLGMVTQHSFMFGSTYERLRRGLIRRHVIEGMCHLGPHAFDAIPGQVVSTTMFVLRDERDTDIRSANSGSFVRLIHDPDAKHKERALTEVLASITAGINDPRHFVFRQSYFDSIPGSPWSYVITDGVRLLFNNFPNLGEVAVTRQGLASADNFRFFRSWWEVGRANTRFGVRDRDEAKSSGYRWFPLMKGGGRRRWWGHQETVVNWIGDGAEMKAHVVQRYPYLNEKWQWVIKNSETYFNGGITFSSVSGSPTLRLMPPGFVFDHGGNVVFPSQSNSSFALLALLNSGPVQWLLKALNDTININVGDLDRLPVPRIHEPLDTLGDQAVALAREDSSEEETTFEFVAPPDWETGLHDVAVRHGRLTAVERRVDDEVYRLYDIGAEDRAAIEAERGVPSAPDPGDAPPASDEDEAEPEAPLDRAALARRWVSYAVGIVMGRFRPGVPGALGSGVTAAGDHRFDPATAAALTALADADGVTVLDSGHDDDLPAKVERALDLALGEAGTAAVVVALGGEAHAPVAGLRRYLEREFFKWHLDKKSYRNRPVYWLLQSPGRNYGLYLFHERITGDTLYLVQGMRYLGAKRSGLRQRIAELEASAAQAEGAARRQLERERDRSADILKDLDEFDRRLDAVTSATDENGLAVGWAPELDDGVLINLAPLNALIPGFPADPKKAWARLEAGDFDWSYTARRYWPERVRRKCRTNRSYAIAHGLEELYEGGPP